MKIISAPSKTVPRRLTQLQQLLEGRYSSRLAVVGVGHDLWGDDGAGPAVVQALQEVVPGNDRLLFIDAGPAPENFTGRLRQFGPDVILLVDAAELAMLPGAYQWIDLADIEGFTASGHSLPLSVFCAYLQTELNCRIFLLGIQPQSLAFGAGLSAPVQRTVSSLTEQLKTLFKGTLSPIVV